MQLHSCQSFAGVSKFVQFFFSLIRTLFHKLVLKLHKFKCYSLKKTHGYYENITYTVADPGFPIGGCQPRGGAPTPEAATFRKICMSKRKNLDPLARAPLDPPMLHAYMGRKYYTELPCAIFFTDLFDGRCQQNI